MNRRSFIRNGIATASAISIVPASVLGKINGHIAPSDKLNIAAVGIGGMGNANLKNIETTENIVALCDVDWKYSRSVFERHPNAKHYWDYRRMLDECDKTIDAIIVATPDHTHAIITADTMTLGKHVYVQKPLTHSVYESRLLTKLANKYQVATQMGNQGASGEGVNLICEWIWNDEIGEVYKVEAYTDRPMWPQGINTPEKEEKIPDTLNWDLFTGPAKYRPYSSMYTPGDWRGWWDYGTGALGDMACHILHPAYKALNLEYPIKVQGNSTLLLADSAPAAQRIKFTFPARDPMPKVNMPEVTIIWSDGNLRPFFPEGYPDAKEMQSVIIYGTKDTLIYSDYGHNPWLLSGRVPNVPKICRRVTGEHIHRGMHEQDWIRACKETPKNRIQPKSNFFEAGPFNEMIVMGVLAVRLQNLNKELIWDGESMKFTNISDNETLRVCVKDGVAFRDGHPYSEKIWSEPISAKQFASELIHHNYRKGWELVSMPT
jgi:predicted dehydrogenase